MQDMQLEKGSQAAVSPDMDADWTPAKWRLMLMFVLIIQCERTITLSVDQTGFSAAFGRIRLCVR